MAATAPTTAASAEPAELLGKADAQMTPAVDRLLWEHGVQAALTAGCVARHRVWTATAETSKTGKASRTWASDDVTLIE